MKKIFRISAFLMMLAVLFVSSSPAFATGQSSGIEYVMSMPETVYTFTPSIITVTTFIGYKTTSYTLCVASVVAEACNSPPTANI